MKVNKAMSPMRFIFGCLATSCCLTLVTSQVAESAFVLQTASVNDVTDKDGDPANMAAGAFAGNDAQNTGAVGVAQLNASFGNLGWTFVTDALPFVGGITGTITLPFNVSGTFALSIKADGGYSLYKFVGNYLTGDEFDFTTAGVAISDSGSRLPADLSHAGLYTTPTAVPEMNSILTWAVLGLTSISAAHWWRRHNLCKA